MGKKRKSPEQSLDDLLRDGIPQRTMGPHKPGAISQLEGWERHAIAILDRFAELEIPDEDSICFPVCGRWRFFATPDERADDLLFNLAIAFWSFNDAFRLFDEMHRLPSYDTAEQLASEIMKAMYFANQVGVVTSSTWQNGERYRHERQRGGYGKAKFKTGEQKAAVVEIIGRYYRPPTVKKTAACLRAVPVVREELNIDADNKTLLRIWNAAHAGQS